MVKKARELTFRCKRAAFVVGNPSRWAIPGTVAEARFASALHKNSILLPHASFGDLSYLLKSKEINMLQLCLHGDAAWPSSPLKYTLGLVDKDGKLDLQPPESLVAMLSAHAPCNRGSLTCIIINGCCTERIGRALHDAGIPVVICWRSKLHDKAGPLFSKVFHVALRQTQDYYEAYELARCVLSTEFDLRDPQIASDSPQQAAGIPLLIA